MDIPNIVMTKIERNLKESPDIPLNLTIVERKSVKKVKLAINPVTTPSGRDLPVSLPPIDDERIIGRTGRMQGERIVTTPARNEKRMSKIIAIYDIRFKI